MTASRELLEASNSRIRIAQMIRILLLVLALSANLAPAQELPPLAPPYEALIVDGKDAERKGLLGKALEFYRKAQELDPKRVDAYFYRARVLSTQRKFAESVMALNKVIELDPKASTAYNLRGLNLFRLGEIDKSLDDFNKYISLEPLQEPYHWQRGIALYYAGKYEEGRRQFEKHQAVNSEDVENAVWHFLCVARAESFAKARESLIPIAGDQRVPMAEVFNLFAGKGTEKDIWKAVEQGAPSPVALEARNFYAHLYLGLYHEAKGDAKKAYEHIKLAATDFASDQYMGDVARVHFKRLLANPPKSN
jgi:lipoprotein NlpI